MIQNWVYRIVHCSATKANQNFKAADVVKWHTDPKPLGNGWKVPGYEIIIERDGTVVRIAPDNGDTKQDPWEITNGVRGINENAKHICLIGGLDNMGNYSPDFTPKQYFALRNILIEDVVRNPVVKIGGHYQFDDKKKFCPGFDVPQWLQDKGFKPINILSNG